MNKVIPKQDISIIKTLLGDADVANLSVREQIDIIEKAMLEYPQIEIPVKHSFWAGNYVREIMIPKGALIVSAYHKLPQIDFMLSGDISVVTGGGLMRIKAPYVGASPQGMKRLGFAHEETWWMDVRATNNTDIDQLEKILYCDTFEEFEEFENRFQRFDFETLLVEYGIPFSVAQSQSYDASTYGEVSLEPYKVEVRESKLSGKGLFAVKPIREKEVIMPARLQEMRTQAGRFTNHSCNPNAEMEFGEDGNIYLVAKRNIFKEEILVNYRQCLELLGRKKICQV
jgi:hypothetical protein